MLSLVLLVFAFVFFVLAALPVTVTAPWYPRLVAAGLAFWVAVELFGKYAGGVH